MATLVPFANAAPIGAKNILAVQVGANGRTTPLDGSATAVLLKEFTSTGTLVQTITLPSTGGSNKLTISGNNPFEGMITYLNGYFCIAGFDAAAGTANISKTNSTVVGRTFAVIDPSGNVDLTTRITNCFPSEDAGVAGPYGAVTDGSRIWMSGKASPITVAVGAGYRTALKGATSSSILSTGQGRTMGAYFGQLYGSNSTAILSFGVGMPSTVAIGAVQPGFPDFAISATDFGFFSPTTLYVSDQTPSPGHGVTRYDWNGSTYAVSYDLLLPTLQGVRSIAVGSTSAGEPMIFAVSESSGGTNSIYRCVDTGLGSPFSLVTTSAGTTQFKSVKIKGPIGTTVQGKINIGSFAGAVPVGNFDIELRQGGVVKDSGSIPVDSQGRYTFATDVPAGVYDVHFRGSHWLGKLVTGVTISGTVTLNPAVLNGDIVPDNSVDFFDYLKLSDGYESLFGEAAYTANAMADLNGDATIDFFDYLILSENYEKEGDN